MFLASSVTPGNGLCRAVCQYVLPARGVLCFAPQQRGVLWKIFIRNLEVVTFKVSFIYTFAGMVSINRVSLLWLTGKEWVQHKGHLGKDDMSLAQCWKSGHCLVFPVYRCCPPLQERCSSAVVRPERTVLHWLPHPSDKGCNAAFHQIIQCFSDPEALEKPCSLQTWLHMILPL